MKTRRLNFQGWGWGGGILSTFIIKEEHHVTLHQLTCLFTWSGSISTLARLTNLFSMSKPSGFKALLHEIVSATFSFFVFVARRAKQEKAFE